MNHLLAQAKDNCKLGKYDEAVKLIDNAIADQVLYPEVLLQKASCLQLTNGKDISIEDIENLYQQALSIDDNYYNTLTELANFQFAVLDKTLQAKENFERALAILQSAVTEAVIGIAKCIEETENEKSAIKYLSEISTNILDKEKIANLSNEFKDVHN